MPLFHKKAVKPVQYHENNNSVHPQSQAPANHHPLPANGSKSEIRPQPPQSPTPTSPVQLMFHCQLAHGSPTGFITGFSSVKELYQKIAEYYDFPTDEVRNKPGASLKSDLNARFS